MFSWRCWRKAHDPVVWFWFQFITSCDRRALEVTRNHIFKPHFLALELSQRIMLHLLSPQTSSTSSPLPHCQRMTLLPFHWEKRSSQKGSSLHYHHRLQPTHGSHRLGCHSPKRIIFHLCSGWHLCSPTQGRPFSNSLLSLLPHQLFPVSGPFSEALTHVLVFLEEGSFEPFFFIYASLSLFPFRAKLHERLLLFPLVLLSLKYNPFRVHLHVSTKNSPSPGHQ